MGAGERLSERNEKTEAPVLRSAARPGLLLLMAWALDAEALLDLIAAPGAAVVVAAAGEGPELETGAVRIQRVAESDVLEEDQRAALRAHLERDGWLLSPGGALAAAAGWKMVEGGEHSVQVVDFVSPLGEPAEVARLLGKPLPLKLPARARVGGIITPQ